MIAYSEYSRDSTTTVYIHILWLSTQLFYKRYVFDGENFWTDIKLRFLVGELIRLSI